MKNKTIQFVMVMLLVLGVWGFGSIYAGGFVKAIDDEVGVTEMDLKNLRNPY